MVVETVLVVVAIAYARLAAKFARALFGFLEEKLLQLQTVVQEANISVASMTEEQKKESLLWRVLREIETKITQAEVVKAGIQAAESRSFLPNLAVNFLLNLFFFILGVIVTLFISGRH
jgi:hypothetical protein